MEKGLFSIIKFIPNPIRDESINVGIILHTPEAGKIKLGYEKNDTKSKLMRVAPKFDKTLIFYLINQLQEIINTTETSEKEDPLLLENIQKQFNKFIVASKPKKIMVENFEEDLDTLFNEFVISSYKMKINEDLLKRLLNYDEEKNRYISYLNNEYLIPFKINSNSNIKLKHIEDFYKTELLKNISDVVFTSEKNEKEGALSQSIIFKVWNDSIKDTNNRNIKKSHAHTWEYDSDREERVNWTTC
ncbi:DUF3037 domain-containing protein [Rossellomorea aquimaris]|uniref:DUF3037 domain-containing protein n=1 Tax=Rossellomorea aquimaris TaxID=189382 RepID=A0A1J6W6A0_9BACI|nr:DUF3037 domain-containing protein [Rossellomorea aquimaris]OIU73173.1 hypothetical protein BHE18_14950 [Rossellomorea aquimaris]